MSNLCLHVWLLSHYLVNRGYSSLVQERWPAEYSYIPYRALSLVFQWGSNCKHTITMRYNLLTLIFILVGQINEAYLQSNEAGGNRLFTSDPELATIPQDIMECYTNMQLWDRWHLYAHVLSWLDFQPKGNLLLIFVLILCSRDCFRYVLIQKRSVSKQEKVKDYSWVETQVNSALGNIWA